MEVTEVVRIDRTHSIEFGRSTWNPNEISARNRYDTTRGNFLPHSSSELPLRDVVTLVREVLDRDLLETRDVLWIMESALDSAMRRTPPIGRSAAPARRRPGRRQT